MADLDRAIRNAATFWTAQAQARGNELVMRDGLLVANGTKRAGQRIMVLSPDTRTDDIAAVLVPTGRAVVEDAYSTLDLSRLGLTSRQLPVMIRDPAPVPEPSREVTKVESVDQLELAERMIVHGFSLEQFQPYEPGEVFPKSLLDRPEFEVFLAGEAGACIAVHSGDASGVYYVTTMPEHRSRGIGRALMHAMLARTELPMTLTASTSGRPLYDSLGFRTVNLSTWWSRA
ncbi:GNAT family N-acetyltransferase [Fodinicola acaciae]|uniref:GNAT family N-acetyltransferase n=1 Tax=Fodinicola acaciae TaxID=2681555 RepID=UPI0013D3203E|nr:GNAT family N-acetyltransferase [Fodinicola acaciae]